MWDGLHATALSAPPTLRTQIYLIIKSTIIGSINPNDTVLRLVDFSLFPKRAGSYAPIRAFVSWSPQLVSQAPQ